jgi:hypothetical protein
MTNPVVLLGTQSNGETLPVQVDATGRLVAEGLLGPPGPPGPEGPEGPEGQIALPPDPYEGALLGWENGQLAWVGGSVPLPDGLFGPISRVVGSIIEIPQDASSLVYGQALQQTNESQEQVAVTLTTSRIKSVTGNGPYTLEFEGTLAENTDLEAFTPGLFLYESGIAPGGFTANTFGETYSATWSINKAYNGSTNNACSPLEGTFVTLSLPGQGIYCRTSLSYWQMLSNPQTCQVVINGTQIVDNLSGTGRKILPTPTDRWLKTLSWNRTSGGNSIDMTSIKVDEVELLDSVGWQYQNASVVSNGFAEGSNSMVVDQGQWKGTDGSGDLNGFDRVTVTGIATGSVSSSGVGFISLRDSDGPWKVGSYVYAPQQRIAERYIKRTELIRSRSDYGY